MCLVMFCVLFGIGSPVDQAVDVVHSRFRSAAALFTASASVVAASIPHVVGRSDDGVHAENVARSSTLDNLDAACAGAIDCTGANSRHGIETKPNLSRRITTEEPVDIAVGPSGDVVGTRARDPTSNEAVGWTDAVTPATDLPVAPPVPTVRIAHPRNGAFVTKGDRVLIDAEVSGLQLPAEGYQVCLTLAPTTQRSASSPTARQHLHAPANESESAVTQIGAHQRVCYADASQRWYINGNAGNSSIAVSLERVLHADPMNLNPGQAAVASTTSNLTIEEADTCAGRWGRPPCMFTRPHCARFPRFRFFLYPLQWLPSAQAANLYYALLGSPLRTENVNEACLFVVLSDIKVANQIKESLEATVARIVKQPLWGNGENHIIFHFGDYHGGFDAQRAIVAASSFGLPFDRSWFKQHRGIESPETSIPQLRQMRAGYDITMPLSFYRCGFDDDYRHLHMFDGYRSPTGALILREQQREERQRLWSIYRSRNSSGSGPEHQLSETAPSPPPQRTSVGDPSTEETWLQSFPQIPPMHADSRPYLLTFKGSLYELPPDHPSMPRLGLRDTLHNGRDIIIAVSCSGLSPECSGPTPASGQRPQQNISTASFPECYSLTTEARQYEYADLLLKSRFAAVVPGEGTHSYRLYEALQAGSIPVLLGSSARPFDGLIAWSSIAVVWTDTSPQGLKLLELTLRTLSQSHQPMLQKMQVAGRLVFESHFKDLNVQLHSMFALAVHRFEAANKAIAAEAEAEQQRKLESSMLSGMPQDSTAPALQIAANDTGLHGDQLQGTAISAGDGSVPDGSTGLQTAANPANSTISVPSDAQQDAAASAATDATVHVPVAPLVSSEHTIAAATDSTVGHQPSSAAMQAHATPPSASTIHAAAVVARAESFAHVLRSASEHVAVAVKLLGPLQAQYLIAVNSSNALVAEWAVAVAEIEAVRKQLSIASGAAGDAATAASQQTAIKAATVRRSAALQRAAQALERHSSIAVPSFRGPDATEIGLQLSAAVDLWLQWIAAAAPLAHDRFVAAIRPTVAHVYFMLSQCFGLLGHLRHAATAMHTVFLLHGPERSGDPSQSESDTRRARNVMMDMRLSPAPVQGQSCTTASQAGTRQPVSPWSWPCHRTNTSTSTSATASLSVADEHPSAFRLGRLLDTPSALDYNTTRVMSGYGHLAHYSGPIPLSSAGAHAHSVPLLDAAGGANTEIKADPSAPLPMALVPEATFQRVASLLEQRRALPLSLHSFMQAHSIQAVRAGTMNVAASNTRHAGASAASSSRSARIAIVSLCAYNASITNITAISTENLKNYCDFHGHYDCFMATQSLDTGRPIAWSKVLLAAHFLPQYDYVMWRDCDSLFLNPKYTVETIITAAATARRVIGDAAATELFSEADAGGETRSGGATPASTSPQREKGSMPGAPPAPAIQPKPLIFSSGGSKYTSNAASDRPAPHAVVDGDAASESTTALEAVRSKMEARRRDLLGLQPGAAPMSPVPAAATPSPLSSGRKPASVASSHTPLFSSPIDLLISEDGLMTNTGVWIIRNCAWSLDFLRRAYGDHSSNVSVPILPFDLHPQRASSGSAAGASVSDLTHGFSGAISSADVGDDDRIQGDAASVSTAALLAMRASINGTKRCGSPATSSSSSLPITNTNAALPTLQAQSAQLQQPPLPHPFVESRMWDQGGVFWELALSHQVAWSHDTGADKDVDGGSADDGARMQGCADYSPSAAGTVHHSFTGCHPDPEPGDTGNADATSASSASTTASAVTGPLPCSLLQHAYADSAHSQHVPQRWINSYPPLLARMLSDTWGRPMHAEVIVGTSADGDTEDGCRKGDSVDAGVNDPGADASGRKSEVDIRCAFPGPLPSGQQEIQAKALELQRSEIRTIEQLVATLKAEGDVYTSTPTPNSKPRSAQQSRPSLTNHVDHLPWLVSFSGCPGFFGWQTCNVLLQTYSSLGLQVVASMPARKEGRY